ncbi:MAG: glycosyltransferase [Pirellulaceae bacterium]
MSTRLLCCSGSLEGGGSERQLWQLVRGVDHEQWQTAVYLLYRRGKYLHDLPDEVDVFDFWSQFDPDKMVVGQAYRQQVAHLTSLLQERSIAVVYDRTYHMTMVTAPACRRAGVPRISTIVSPPSRDFGQGKEKFGFLKRWILARAYRSPLDITIALTEDSAQDAERFYRLPEGSVKVIPSPVDVQGVLASAWKGPVPFTREENEFHVCVVGRLSAEKGQATAIEAFTGWQRSMDSSRTQPKVKAYLHIVGDGPDREALQRRADEQECASSIRFHGFLDNPYSLIKESDLLLLPSEYEGLPNVVLESMALGTPVLATRCSESLLKIFGHSALNSEFASIVEVGDSSAMALELSKLAEVARRGQLRDRAATAKEYVEHHHGMPQWLDRMQSLFSQQVASLPQRPGKFSGDRNGELT